MSWREMPTGCPFRGSAPQWLHPQFSGPYSRLRYNLGGQAVSVVQPSIPSSHRPMHIPAGGVLIPLGLTPWHWTHPGKKGKRFPGFLLLRCTAFSLSSAPHSCTSGTWGGWSSCPRSNTSPDAATATAAAASPASPESWLLSSLSSPGKWLPLARFCSPTW